MKFILKFECCSCSTREINFIFPNIQPCIVLFFYINEIIMNNHTCEIINFISGKKINKPFFFMHLTMSTSGYMWLHKAFYRFVQLGIERSAHLPSNSFFEMVANLSNTFQALLTEYNKYSEFSGCNLLVCVPKQTL